MSRPGTVRTWLGLCLLAALAACGGSGGGGGGPPDPGGLPVGPPSAYLQFHHPVSGRALASGASYEYPHSLRPGERMQPFFLPAAESIPDPVPITYVLEPPWPPGLEYSSVSRALRGTLRAGGAHPPSYRLDYRASAPGHRDVHLSVVLHLPPTLRSAGFTSVSFPIGQRTVRVMPAASGGRPPYTYELAGVGCRASWLRLEGRSLHGSPTAANQHESDRDCRWRVTDFLGGMAEFRTRISVETGGRSQLYFPRADGTPYADGASLGSLGTLVQGEEVPPRTGFFPAAGGAPMGTPISYELEVANGPPGVQLPPSGLGIDTAGPSLTGTINDPEWPAGTYSLYYIASARGYADARLTVSFELENPLRLGAPSTDSFSFQVGELNRVRLPEPAGGEPPYRYSLEQCPLAWIEVDGTELVAHPQPEHNEQRRLCRYRVTDADGAFVEIVLEVSAVGSALRFDASFAGPFSFTTGEFAREPLPQAAGGAPPYRYSLDQCPLDWLELVGTELAANPRPEHAGERRLCRYRVTDAVGASVELTLHVSAVAGDGSSLRFNTSDTRRSYSFDVGTFKEEPLPVASGGSPPYRYSLEQCPLDWLELVGTKLIGDPLLENAGEQRLCRYRVTDSTNAFVELLLSVSAGGGGGTALRFNEGGTLPKDGDSLSFVVGEFKRELLRDAIGGTPPYSYSFDQCTVDWLQLVGTELAANPRPEHAGEAHLCRYRVTDTEGNFVDQVLKVEATSIPVGDFQFENRHIVDRDLPVGSVILPIVLPLALNGKGTVEYKLSPVLPTGLIFCPPSGQANRPEACLPASTAVETQERPEIQGNPSSVSVLTRYCIQATDGNDSTAPSRCFNLRTVDHEVPRFTVNLQGARDVFLYSRLTHSPTPAEIGTTTPATLVNRSIQLPAAFLPSSWGGSAAYDIVPELAPFTFVSDSRLLTSPATPPADPTDHPVPTPVVYTYGVRRLTDGNFFAAAICFELGRRIAVRPVPPASPTHVYEDHWLTLTFRDEAVRTSTGEYLCHPNPRGDDNLTTGSTAQSNPVHDALGMVHGRRAVRLAHELIGERVRGASPDGSGADLFSDVDLGRMWGRSGGFSWSGTGESLLGGAQVVHRGGALQLGLVAGFHRTTLDYRAEAVRLEGRYSEGEHVTELYAMHPFAAWRFATDSVVWGSVGAGAGSLWFEDEAPPFDERRRSDLDLGSAALGFSHPLPSSPLGTFFFSGLAEHIALRIEGEETEHGIRPRSLRGSDLGLGLDWRRRPVDAEPSLVPSLSLGVRHQTGDGAAGSLIDVAGSIAYRPGANPLSFDVGASTLLGIGGNDSGSWDVRASARFDPDPGARGLELSLRSVLGAASNDPRAAYGLDGELAYGLFGGAFGSTVRPYIAISSFAGASGARRAAGLHLRDEPDYRLSLETFGHTGTDSDGMKVRLHRLWP